MAEMAGSTADVDGIDAVRMTWNVWPRSKVDASKCVVPISAAISPIRPSPEIPVLPYLPLRCRSCVSTLNPYSFVDYSAKIWICPFCFQRNHFPQHYAMISETNVPAELYPQYTTVEYAPPASDAAPPPPPVFLFVLDICIIEEEMGFVKSALRQAIGLLPDHALVGFISFGTQVHVHELGFADLSKVYVFRGSKDLTKDQILEQLGLVVGSRGPKGVQNGLNPNIIHRFLLPASDCEYTLNSLLDELQIDLWPVQSGNRASRCTGVALSVAAGLLGACLPGTGARTIALVGGPCTEGPGMIVSKDLSEPVRSHKDLDKDAAPHFNKAVKFYENLAKQLVSQGHVLDLFASALDQVGVAEMKVVVEKTGGLVVLAESFGHPVFRDSFKRIYEDGEQSLGLAFNGTLEIFCSKDIKMQGIIGPCTSLEKKGPSCSDTVIGQGNTTSWKMCGLDKSTCLTVFFDVSPSDRSNPPGAANQYLYLQFLTNYQNPQGQMRLRVTTIQRKWADSSANSEELVEGFDQEAAAVVMARLTSLKMEMEVFSPLSIYGDHSLYRSAMEENEDWGCCSDGTDTEDQETINLKDWNDEEYNHNNPFKPSLGFTPKLQFRKVLSKARWDEDMGMAAVTEKKGGMWTTTGIIRGGKLYCLLEETLFLAERGALILLDANDAALSLTDIYEKVAKDKNRCSWESFEVYRHLKSLGYIINRHSLPWTLKINKSCCNSNCVEGTLESDDTSKPTREDETSSIIFQLQDMRINEMMPNYDVYLPNSKFRKLAPGNPSFILYLLSDDPPSKAEIQVLEAECKGIPLKFCHSEHGRVSFFSFDKVELPFLP